MEKVAGYGRVSTLEQASRGTSSEEQKSIIENKCNREGFQLVEFYSDDGYSGKNIKRPGLTKLLNDAKEGRFELLLFTKLDRLGRDIRDIKNILYELEALKIKFHCIQQPEINNDSMYGNLILNILSAFAEFERDLISDRTGGGRTSKWKKGQAVIGSLPLGYKRGNGCVVIDDERSAIYQRIVSLYIDENRSMRDIAIMLKDEGIPSPSGRSKYWYTTTISDILRNPCYMGTSYQNRYEFEQRQGQNGKQYYAVTKNEKSEDDLIKLDYPPLISSERYRKIQDRIEFQKRKPKKHHFGHNDKFMAENVLFCGHCNSKISKRHNPKQNFHYCCYWWEASAKERKTYDHDKCVLGYVNADEVDEQIFREVVKILSAPGQFAKSWYKDDNIEELNLRVKNLRNQVDELEKQLRIGFKRVQETNSIRIKKIYEEELAKNEIEYKKTIKLLEKAEIEQGFSRNKIDRLEKFEKAIKDANLQNKYRLYSDAKYSFEDFLYGLPFKEKKRIIEAVISPETGGKCFLRLLAPFDDCDDIRGLSNDDLRKMKEEDRSLIVDVDMDFKMDLNKLEGLISSLNDRVLLDSVVS